MSHTTHVAIDCTHTTDTDTSTLSGGRWSSACHIQHTRLLIVHTPLIQTPQHSVVDAGHQHVTYNTRGYWLYTHHWYRHLNTQWWTLVISISHTTHTAIDCTQTTDTDTSTLSGGCWSSACHIQHTRLLIVHTPLTPQHKVVDAGHQHVTYNIHGYWLYTWLIQTPQHSVVDTGHQHVTYNTRGYWLYTLHWYRHLNTQWWTLVISMSHTTYAAIDCTHTTDTDTSTLSGGRWSSACHIQHTRLLIVHTPLIQTPQHSVVDAGHQHVTYNIHGYWLYTHHWYRHLNTQWWTLVISMSHTTHAAIDCTHSTDTDTSTLSGGRWSSACHIQHTRLLIVHTPLIQTPQHSVVDAGHQHVTYNIHGYWLYTHHWYRHLNTQWWTLVISMSHTTHAAIDCTHTTDTNTSTLSGGRWSSACHIQHTRLLIVHTPLILTPQHSVVDAGHQHVTYNTRGHWLYTCHWYRHLNTQWWTLVISMSHTTHAAIDCTQTTDTNTSTLSGGRWSAACHIQHMRLLIVHTRLIQTPQHTVVDAGHQHVTYNTRGYWLYTPLILTPQHSVVDAGHQHITYNTRGYWLYTPLILTPQHSVVDAGHQHVTYNIRGYWLYTHHWYRHLNTQWWTLVISMSHTTYAAIDCTHTTDTDTSTLSGGRWSSACHIQHTRLLIVHTPLILTPQHSVVDAGHQHVTYNTHGYWLYTHHWYRHLNTQWWTLVISMSHTTHTAIDCTHTTDTNTSTLSGGRWSSACHIQHTRLLIVHTTDTNTSTLSSGRWLSACHIQHTQLLIVHTPLILTPQHSVVDAGHQHVTYNTHGYWLYTHHWY